MRIKSLIGSAGVLLVANSLVASGLFAQNAALTGDVTISATAPSTNYNSGTHALTLNIATGNAGLVQFDLSAYSPSAVVNAAYLQVYADQVTAGGTLNFTLVTSPWSESTVTYGTQPTTAASAFDQPGTGLDLQSGNELRSGNHRNRRHRHSARFQREHGDQPPGPIGHQRCRRSGCSRSHRASREYRPHRLFRRDRSYRTAGSRGRHRADRTGRSTRTDWRQRSFR